MRYPYRYERARRNAFTPTWGWAILILLLVATAALLSVGCKSDDSPTAPTAQRTSSSSNPPAANTTTPTVVEPTPTPVEDGSGGRSLSAAFTTNENPWTAKISNTTHNPGTVSYCVYDIAGPGGWGNQGDPVHSKAYTLPARTELEVDIYDVYQPGECVLEILSFECELTGEPGEGQVTCEAETNIPATWEARWTQAFYDSAVTRTVTPQSKISFTTTLPRGLAVLELAVEAFAVCGDELTFQADLIRGPECGQAPANHAGYNFGYVYGTLEETQRTEVQAERIWKFEKPCKDWYPGSLPAEGKARITFMSKTETGLYLWRLQNNTDDENLTVKGPGFDETFSIQPGTIGAFTTTSPYYGLSVYDCDGTRLHGTASANETTEPWCDWPELDPGECEVCGPPDVLGQVVDAASNPYEECAAFGNYVPVCKTEVVEASLADVELPSCRGVEADFWICKAGPLMVASLGLPDGYCEGIDFDQSHITGCVCAYD
jgi:hypothetical protein